MRLIVLCFDAHMHVISLRVRLTRRLPRLLRAGHVLCAVRAKHDAMAMRPARRALVEGTHVNMLRLSCVEGSRPI